MEALWRARRHEFEHRAVAGIACRYPEDFARLGPEGAVRLVHQAERFGAVREIEGENALSGLVQLFIEFGPGFEMAPYRAWALRILERVDLPGSLRVHLVRARLFGFTQGRRMVVHQEAG
jgi:hypothetical protein